MNPPRWWCCLSLRERLCLTGIAPLFPPLFFGAIPKFIFDAYWVGSGLSLEARKVGFLEIYGLRIVTIEDDPLNPIPGIEPVNPLVWGLFAVWSLLPAAGCLEGCTQVDYS
jgi:hypothetical protein